MRSRSSCLLSKIRRRRARVRRFGGSAKAWSRAAPHIGRASWAATDSIHTVSHLSSAKSSAHRAFFVRPLGRRWGRGLATAETQEHPSVVSGWRKSAPGCYSGLGQARNSLWGAGRGGSEPIADVYTCANASQVLRSDAKGQRWGGARRRPAVMSSGEASSQDGPRAAQVRHRSLWTSA